MDNTTVTLSQSEWTVMEALWHQPKTLMELVRELADTTHWAKSTVTTMVRRMEDKGLITYELEGRAKRFSTAVSREAVVAVETDSLLQRAYHGSVSLMLSALTKKQDLSREDIQELRDILAQAEEGLE